MVATSRAKLLKDEAVQAVTQRLLPLAELCTPNIPEAEILAGMHIASEEDMIAAANIISDRYDCAVLCKGGHQYGVSNENLPGKTASVSIFGRFRVSFFGNRRRKSWETS